MRFSLGQIVATPGVLTLGDARLISSFVSRHAQCDWGDVCEEDRKANEWALRNGARLFSVYRTPHGETVWVITEADRSSTCLLLPEELLR